MLIALSLDEWNTVADIGSALVTTGAIVVGGWWAYRRFVRERTIWPRANLELVLTHRQLTDEVTLLNIAVKVLNGGIGVMQLGELRADVYQVLPLDPETHARLNAKELIPEGDVEAKWPVLDWKKCTWGTDRPEIEPGEHDRFAFDFFVPTGVRTVSVYAHLRNIEKQEMGRNLAWTVTGFYDLGGTGGVQSTDNLVGTGSNERERDQATEAASGA